MLAALLSLAIYTLLVGAGPALLPGGVALEDLSDGNLAGLSVLLLTPADLDSTSPEEWGAMGSQAVISAQPGPWVVPPQGGWVHVSTDGVRMWVEEGK